MKKWSAHMLTGMKNMTRKMSVGRTCRTDAGGPACRRGEIRSAIRVARFAVVAVMAMVFGLAGFVASADAAVTIGTWSSAFGAGGTTLAHTAGAGSDRVIFIAVDSERNGTQNSPTVTYGGQNVQMVTEIQETPGATTYNNWNWIGYCDEACIGAAGNTTITATYAAAPDGMTIAAVTLTGVDQTTPVAASNATSTGTQTISMTLVNAAGDMALYNVEMNYAGSGTNTISVPTNFTEGVEIDSGGTNFTSAVGSSTNSGTLTINPGGNATSSRTTLTAVSFAAAPTCSPDPAPTMNGGSYSGNPLDFCAAVTEGATNTITNYEVIDSGVSADDNFNDNSLDSKWAMKQVGNTSVAAVTETGGQLRVTNRGADLWTTDDDYTFVQQGPFTGDFTITSQVVSLTNTDVWAKAGVLILDDDPTVTNRPKYAGMVVTPGNNFSLQTRYTDGSTATGDYGSSTGGTSTGSGWVRVVRTGSTVEGFYSTNGTNWTSIGTDTVSFVGDVYAGVWTTSHDAAATATAVFDNFTTSGLTTGGVLYSGASCNSIPTTGWSAGTLNLNVTYTNSCSTPGQLAAGSFTYSLDTTPPTAGTVTITSPASGTGTYAPSSLTFTTVFTDAQSAVTCEYTTNGTTWSAGSISGTGPYTCSASPTGLSGSVTLNMRGTSGGGGPVPATTALTRTVDATGPTNGTLTVTPGNTQLGLSWTASTDAGIGLATTNTYKLVRATGATAPADCTGTAIYQGTTRTYTDTGRTNGTQYSYRVCAYDVYGNVSTGATGSGTPLANAAPTLSITQPDGVGDIVSVGANFNIRYTLADSDNTVTAAFYYDVNADMTGGTPISGACASAAEGSGVTCSWNTTGVTAGSYYVYGVTSDGVNAAVSAVSPGMITITDTRTTAGTASAAPGNTEIVITAPYAGDIDTDNDLLIEWGLNGVNYTLGSSTRPHAASPYTYTIPSLTNGTAYQVRVTYQDTDGVLGTAVQTFTNVTPAAWADNEMLHNSLRFACSVLATDGSTITTSGACTTASGTWNEDRRHAGGWGTSGVDDQYGAILCSTCHTKNSGNIKRVTKQVPLTGIPGKFEADITYTSAEEGTADLGSTSSDGLNHTTANRICEVCHTYNATDPGVSTPTGGVRFHGYDMSASGESHYVDADCIKCHAHKVGFRASCSACHGNPPETGKLVTTTPTGSTIAGAHLTHTDTEGIDCAVCHDGSVGAGATHDTTGVVTLTFNNLPGGVTGGSYDGQAAVTYDTTDAVNTNLSNTGTKTCANYCHGSTIAGTDPAWDGTAVCGSCHAVTAATVSALPSGISHNTHVGQGKDCSLCHGAGYTNASGSEAAPAGHVDGAIVYDVTAIGGTTTYNNTASGTIANTAPSSTYANCANVSCHGNADPGPKWNDAASVVCGSCHGTVGTYSDARDGAPTSGQTSEGKHAAHLGVSNDFTSDYCSLCHNGAGSGTAKHADNTVDFAFNITYAGAGATYTPGATPSCSGLNAANCHAGTASWDPAATIACTDCHTGSGAGAKAVGSTSSHTLVTTGGTFGDCTNCHGGHYGTTGGVDIPNNDTVGINYGHGGIKLGGTGTATNINSVATADLDALTIEAEMCWTCHDAQTIKISEWGTNNNADGVTYDYGSLNQVNWVGATWTSAVFSYKTGAIQSTHTANSAGTSAVSGANYAKTETLDAVGNIRCSYCHDVHGLNKLASDNSTGKPYLRGTWKGNPYNEDGAPRNGAAGSWTTFSYGGANSGQMPRVSASATNSATKGGFWIDQNSGNPNNGETLASTAGLCTLCHGTNVDTMDETTGENLWVSGGNGHQNAVIGGSGTTATANNIFSIRKRGSNQVWDDNGNSNYYMSMGGWTPQMARRAFGYRGDQGNIRLAPTLNGEHRFFNGFQWDNPPAGMALQVDDYQMVGNSTTAVGAITQSQYHTFNCGKCHNPHASRLPKLMITNCLDTAQNTWDETINGGATGAPSPWTGTDASQWPAAQNCHRLTDDHSTLTRGAGWNTVTPW